MESILPTNEFVEVEGRQYLNPQVGIDEAQSFIENLRATQGQQNQEIAQQTQRLGTDVPTVLGGLTGADSYFTSRYQTPQTNANVANLRATAQAAALNEVLANEQAIWKKRYQDAYKNYQKRQYNRAKSAYGGGGGGTTTPSTSPQVTGGVEENPTDEQGVYSYTSAVTAQPGYYTVIGPDGYAHLVDMETGEETEIAPPAGKNGSSGSGGMGRSGFGGGGGGGGGR